MSDDGRREYYYLDTNRTTRRAFLQCIAAFAAFAILTAIAHFRPSWLKHALEAATFLSAILVLIGVQELWSRRRPW